ncbi:Lipid A biosynthesis lauroyl acyltransferase [hydrothermal vent metagenome]|uniref:Lipid A biosynthesis lauroyl acyltransferase n=1 Tax=hydrothermal vent metagenome TaxID=652676 RepID=A0A3B0YHV3_9ZZZZ
MADVPTSPAIFSIRFLMPRFWPTWLMFGVLRIIILLPYRWQMRIGRLIGRLALKLAKHRRKIAEVNLALCFPETTPQQQASLLKAHFDSLGCGIVETALCWWGSESKLRGITRLTGIEHLQAALKRGKGVILLSAHFTTLELGGRLLAMHTPFHVLYRQHKNPLFEAVMRKSRQRRFEKAIARDDMRDLLASLKSGMPVWYAPDQNHGGSQSVFAPFFGVPASTLSTPSRIAKISGAAVVPFYPTRLPDDSGYQLTLYPALENFPSDDAEQDATRLNALLEKAIREMPEQYLWVHRRFKTRPEGEAYPYA